MLEHASICIYDALKYHGPNRKIGPRAQFFYVFRNKKKVWFHTYTIVLLVNCLGSYLLEGVVFTTFPQASILAYILNFCCLGVYIADLVFQWLYTTRHSFWRRRWNRVQVVVVCDVPWEEMCYYARTATNRVLHTHTHTHTPGYIPDIGFDHCLGGTRCVRYAAVVQALGLCPCPSAAPHHFNFALPLCAQTLYG